MIDSSIPWEYVGWSVNPFVDFVFSSAEATLGSGWPRGHVEGGADERHDALRFVGTERERCATARRGRRGRGFRRCSMGRLGNDGKVGKKET